MQVEGIFKKVLLVCLYINIYIYVIFERRRQLGQWLIKAFNLPNASSTPSGGCFDSSVKLHREFWLVFFLLLLFFVF